MAIRFFALLIFFTSFSVSAEVEKEEWYLAKNGQYVVRENNYGNIYATISNSKSGKVNVYLEHFDEEDCSASGSDETVDHDPIYINGTLVKFLQYCDGNMRVYFPATSKGRKFLLNQFITQSYVDVVSVDREAEFKFSAIGFTKHYNEYSLKNKGI